MALVITLGALSSVAALLGLLARLEESLLSDPEVRAASRPAPVTARAAAMTPGGRTAAPRPGRRPGHQDH